MQPVSQQPISEQPTSLQPILAKWAAGAGVADRVLLFRETRVSSARRGKRQARRLRHAQRRALLRRLEHVTSQLERTPEYRRSLQSVLELGSQLQGVLDATQRERWLALEEALFDHSARLHRAYFCAGVEYGQSRALGASVSNQKTKTLSGGVSGGASASTSAPYPGAQHADALELEILRALARWLGKLMRE